MAIAHVQDTVAASTSTEVVSEQSNTFGTNPTVGNYVVCFALAYNENIPSITFSDTTGGNSWTVALFVNIGIFTIAIGVAKVAVSGSNFKVTATSDGNSPYWTVIASEFSGVKSTSPVDGSGTSASNTTNPIQPGSMSFTAGDLILAAMANSSPTNPETVTTPTGFTRAGVQTDGVNYLVAEAVYAIGPASPTNPAWNNPENRSWIAGQIALLAEPGATAVYCTPWFQKP